MSQHAATKQSPPYSCLVERLLAAQGPDAYEVVRRHTRIEPA